MTKRLVWHVGTPKSGTTFLQGVLRRNRDALAEAGILVAGEDHLDLVRSGMAVREDPGLAKLPERARTSWDRVVRQVLDWPGDTAVLSYELFAGASPEQVDRARERFAGIEVSVVVTARELGGVVSSAWQERLKFGLTTPLADWEPRPESAGPAAQWSWRTLDPASVAERWQTAAGGAAGTHVVTVPPTGPKEELWRRFAEAGGLAVPGLRLEVESANESLSPARAEVLRRVNELVAERLEGPREASVWLRDTLAHRVLARGGEEKPGLTDEQFARVRQRAAQSLEALRAASYPVHGDLGDLGPLRPSGRLPHEVPASEIADVAVEALGNLLLDQREQRSRQSPPAPTAEPEPTSVVAKVRRHGAGWVLSRLDRRVAELEDRVRQDRRLHLRVAELEDLVAELLLPAAQRDEAAVRKAITSYRQQSL